MRIPYREKCEKIPQTVRTPNECAGCYASSDLEFHELLYHRAKHLWDELKVNVVIGSVWCIAESRNVVGIPPIFCKLLFTCSDTESAAVPSINFKELDSMITFPSRRCFEA